MSGLTRTQDDSLPDAMSFRQCQVTVADDEALTLDFAVPEGAFVLAQLHDALAIDILLDAVHGLVQPTAGALRVLGHAYTDLSAEDANALRGLIGCIDDPPVFPPHIPVIEALLLAGRFHTRRGEDALLADAARLCRGFGLPGIPAHAPDGVSGDTLRRVACVRALLDRPRLLLVAERDTPLPVEVVAALLRNLLLLQASGCGVLWLTLETFRLRDARLPASQRLVQEGDRLGADLARAERVKGKATG